MTYKLYSQPVCRECGEELQDVNEGRAGLRFGPPAWECTNPECPRNPNYAPAAPQDPEPEVES